MFAKIYKSILRQSCWLVMFTGCSESAATWLEGEQNFVLRMYGLYSEADVDSESTATASGIEPRWMDVQLESVTLVDDAGVEEAMLEAEDATEFRILGMSQKLLTKPLTDMEGRIFQRIDVVLYPEVGVEGRQKYHTVQLDNPVTSLEGIFTVQEAKELTFAIQIPWKNLVQVDEESGEEVVAVAPRFPITADK